MLIADGQFPDLPELCEKRNLEIFHSIREGLYYIQRLIS